MPHQVVIALQVVLEGVTLGSLYALMALGIAVVFGIMRLVNFAYGELIMIGGYVLTWGVISGKPLPILILAVIVVVVLSALAQERVAFRPVRGAEASTLLVTSFALSYFLQSTALALSGARPVGIVLPIETATFVVYGLRLNQLDLVTILATFALLAVLTVFIRRTDTGLHMRASAEDFTMARLLGVRANRVIASAFAVSGALAAAVALLLSARVGYVGPTTGVQPVLIAFISTVIGGMGSLTGAVLGGFLLSALTIGVQALLPPGADPFRDAFAFTIVIALLLIRPEGIISMRAGRSV